jgi:hypothetical protein
MYFWRYYSRTGFKGKLKSIILFQQRQDNISFILYYYSAAFLLRYNYLPDDAYFSARFWISL